MNLKTILERVKEILESNTPLQEKINTFQIGEKGDGEDNNTITADSYPAIIVSTPIKPFITRETLGHSTNSDNMKIIQISITVIVDSATPEDNKLELLDLVSNVSKILEENPTFTQNGTDPKFSRSYIADISEHQNRRGTLLQAATIIIQGTVGHQSTISIGDIEGLQDIPVLSSNVRNTETNVPIHDTSRNLKGYAPIAQTHARHYEIEWSGTIEEKLIQLKNARNTIQITDNGIQYNGLIGAINSTVRFDQLKIIIIQFDIF